jgi:hypothetical protein
MLLVTFGSSVLFAQTAPTSSPSIVRETNDASSCNVCPARSQDTSQESFGMTETHIAGFVPDVTASSGSHSFMIFRETGKNGLAAGSVEDQASQSDHKPLAITRETSRNHKALAPIKIDLVAAKTESAATPSKPSAEVHNVDVNVTPQIDAKAVKVTVTASEGLSILGLNEKLEQQVSWTIESLKSAMTSRGLTIAETGAGEHRLFIAATILTADGQQATKVDSFLVGESSAPSQKPLPPLVRGPSGQLIQEVPAEVKER